MLTIIDGHEFEEMSECFYKAVEPYEINITEWMYDFSHIEHMAIIKRSKTDNNIATLYYLTTSAKGIDALLSLSSCGNLGSCDYSTVAGFPKEFDVGGVYV